MKISYPGVYHGYEEIRYDSYVRHSTYVTVRDGTKLAVDYLIPAKGGMEQKGPFPVIFEFTPYNRCNYGSGLRTIDMESYDYDGAENNAYILTSYGYVFAKADVRGTGASYGSRQVPNNETECKDGYDLVEWLGTQAFSNGKVGMIGSSYTGQTQLETIRMNPPHLKACCIGNTNFDAFDGWMRGGIISDFGNEDEEKLLGKDRSKTIADRVFETVPTDEDKDAFMLREAVTQQETGGLWQHLFDDLYYRDSISCLTGTQYLNEISQSRYLEAINKSDVAVYLLTGMYDPYRRDAFIMMKNLTLKRKLTFGSWYHCFGKFNPDWSIEHIRWFDYWLKGIDNGIMNEKPYFLKCENNPEKDNFYDQWSAEMDKGIRFYLQEKGRLDVKPQQKQQIEYQAIYGIKTSTEDYYAGEIEEKGLVFETTSFEEDVVFIGHPRVNLVFEIIDPDCRDLDFYVTLSDYDEETKQAHLISDGRIRSSFRETQEPFYDFLGLPWHPGTKETEMPLKMKEEYTIEIDLMPISYEVKKNHRLHLAIANSMGCFYYLGKEQYMKDKNPKGPKWILKTGSEDATTLFMPQIYAEEEN